MMLKIYILKGDYYERIGWEKCTGFYGNCS